MEVNSDGLVVAQHNEVVCGGILREHEWQFISAFARKFGIGTIFMLNCGYFLWSHAGYWIKGAKFGC